MQTLDFNRFFEDVHGAPPFPWQSRLTAQLVETHEWPDLIDLPTASGKTACIDIALFHLAWCAEHGAAGDAARRIVFVVDRRIIVDAAAIRAERLRDALESRATTAIRSVADALRKLGGGCALECQKLRGGMPKEQSFAPNPAQPMVITSTIDQVGSRLLFRGYGLSPRSAPVHAGLLGFDSLILLDEAHLGTPFAATVEAIRREQARATCPFDGPRPVRFVPLSATHEVAGRRFQLDAADLAHPLIAKRRAAPKPSRLVHASTKPAERIKALAKETLRIREELSTHTPAICVVVNRVKTARSVFALLREHATLSEVDIELLIGRSRPLDKDEVARRVQARAGAGRPRLPSDRGLIVVATQTIEVGADLDFQGMVTECAPLSSLKQRLGRLDRLGDFGQARAVIVGGDEPDDDPVYGPALARTWDVLNEKARALDGDPVIDFSIAGLENVFAGVRQQALHAVQRPLLQLTPAFTRLLSQTAPLPAYESEPDVEALLHGMSTVRQDVQVIWRAHVPALRLESGPTLDLRRGDVVNTLLEMNPPMHLEALSLPLSAVRQWLRGQRLDSAVADMEGAESNDDSDDVRSGKSPRDRVWRRAGNEWQTAFARELRPGDTIVVPSAYGGCDQFGFAPESSCPVPDLSAAGREALGRSALLILTRQEDGHPVSGQPEALALALANAFKKQDQSEGEAEPADLLKLILESARETLVAEYPWILDEPLVEIMETMEHDESRPFALIATPRRVRRGDFSDEEDFSSSRTVPVRLADHNAGVGGRARALAEAVGLNSELVRTLGRAGDLHDIGKADPRFQDLLRAGDDTTLAGELLGKGIRRIRRQRVRMGERHEAYSVAFLRENSDLLESIHDPELARFVIGTHHGYGRPLMPDRPDDGVAFSVGIGGRQRDFEGVPELGAAGSGWPSLFWRLNRRYGPWGLAYLEAVLRSADSLRSADEVELGGGT